MIYVPARILTTIKEQFPFYDSPLRFTKAIEEGGEKREREGCRGENGEKYSETIHRMIQGDTKKELSSLSR